MSGDSSAIACAVCVSLSQDELRDLDLLLADPGKWPATLWDAIGKPARMTPAARKFGQVEIGMAWLGSHNLLDIDRRMMLRHIKAHVVAVPRMEDLFANAPPDGALMLIEFMTKAIKAGNKALTQLIAKVESDPESFSISQLLDVAEFAAKLADREGRKKADVPQLMEGGPTGFMGTRPSQRVQHHRIREIDGVARPVVDEGPKDRAHYNERADQEGGPRLG